MFRAIEQKNTKRTREFKFWREIKDRPKKQAKKGMVMQENLPAFMPESAYPDPKVFSTNRPCFEARIEIDPQLKWGKL